MKKSSYAKLCLDGFTNKCLFLSLVTTPKKKTLEFRRISRWSVPLFSNEEVNNDSFRPYFFKLQDVGQNNHFLWRQFSRFEDFSAKIRVFWIKIRKLLSYKVMRNATCFSAEKNLKLVIISPIKKVFHCRNPIFWKLTKDEKHIFSRQSFGILRYQNMFLSQLLYG